MDTSMQPLIDSVYEEIVEKMHLDRATLFGQSIDAGNMKQMVIAAYYAGEAESRNQYGKYRALDQRLAEVTR